MRVDIEYVKLLYQQMDIINRENLKNIEWYENGIKLNIDPELLEEWKFIGLSNVYFILNGFYRNGRNL